MPGSRKFLVVHGHHRLARRVVLRQAHSANCLSKIVARLRKLCNNKMGIMQASTNLILAADFISSFITVLHKRHGQEKKTPVSYFTLEA